MSLYEYEFEIYIYLIWEILNDVCMSDMHCMWMVCVVCEWYVLYVMDESLHELDVIHLG